MRNALLLLVATATMAAAASLGSQAALDSIRAEIKRGRTMVKELSQKEGTFKEQIEQIGLNLGTSETYIAKLDGEVTVAEREHRKLLESLAGAQRDLAEREAAMSRRLRAMYKTTTPDFVELFVTSKSIAELLTRTQYFRELARYDRMLLASIDKTRATVAERAEAARKQELSLRSVKSEKEQEKQALLAEKQQQETLLASVKEQKAAYLAQVKQLEAASREMTALLKKLKTQAAVAAKKAATTPKKSVSKPVVAHTTGGPFERKKGGLPWPLEGPVVKRYGRVVHPVYQTVTMNSGIDIGGKIGTAVSSVAAGTIEYVGTMRGYGQFVIVNHGGGYRTIYAHLERIVVKQDQEISGGIVIASLGAPGSPDERTALHFQVRRESETLDPAGWLSNR